MNKNEQLTQIHERAISALRERRRWRTSMGLRFRLVCGDELDKSASRLDYQIPRPFYGGLV